MKLEELLPKFREGAKIRLSDWDKDSYISVNCNNIVQFDIGLLARDTWEFYNEPVNFQEALDLLKSGKSLRRRHWLPGYYIYIQDNVFMDGNGDNEIELSLADIIGTDWEIV